MQRNLDLKGALWLCVLIAGTTVFLLGDWQFSGSRILDLSTSQNVALRHTDLSAFESVALRFPELSASENVALRFPGLATPVNVAQRFPDLLAAENLALRSHETTTTDDVSRTVNSTTFAGLAAPAPFVRLMDFQVAAALPPIGASRFCLRYPGDCKVHGIDFRHRNITLTPERWNDLNVINRVVNRSISAEVTLGSGATEEWVIYPAAGDCKDYAITKRHELLTRGWPSRSLLLSEVELPSGEHHLLLVVRVKDADLVSII